MQNLFDKFIGKLMSSDVYETWHLSIKYLLQLHTKDYHNTKSMQNEFSKKCYGDAYYNMLRMINFSFYTQFV